MISVALLGVAHIHAPGFLKKLKERQDIQVKALWDHDAARQKRRCDEFGFTAAASLDQVWADPELPAVVICSETNRHEELVLAAARARKHMFVEKPLGMGASDAAAMARAVRRAGVLFQTGYFMRSNPAMQFLKEQIAQGALGTITRIRGSNCHSGSLKGLFDTDWRWMADPAVAGCGAFGDLGTHLLDIMMWLCGPVASVAARLARGTARYGDCDEFGEALLEFRGGALGTLAAGWVDVANPVSIEVCGMEGHATIVNGRLYFQSAKVQGADGKEPWSALPPALPHAFDLFLDAVNGKPDIPLVPVEEAADRSRVMGAMYKAHAMRKWIALK